MAQSMLYLFCSIKQKRLLYQRFNKRICEIAKEYPKCVRRSISRHAKFPTTVDSDEVGFDKRHDNPGRPRKFTDQFYNIRILREIMHFN